MIDFKVPFILMTIAWGLSQVATYTAEPDIQCWTNTIPQDTNTWHRIKCPKGYLNEPN